MIEITAAKDIAISPLPTGSSGSPDDLSSTDFCEKCKGSGCGFCQAGAYENLSGFYLEGTRPRNLADAGNEVLSKRWGLQLLKNVTKGAAQ